ncbi:hypothetical protein IWW52_002244, partial [Coemansia sp. RSA 2704]
VLEVLGSTSAAPGGFQVSRQPPGRMRKRMGVQQGSANANPAHGSDDQIQVAAMLANQLQSPLVIEVGDSPDIDHGQAFDVDAEQPDRLPPRHPDLDQQPTAGAPHSQFQHYLPATYPSQMLHQHQQYTNPGSYQPHSQRPTGAGGHSGQMPFAPPMPGSHANARVVLPTPQPYVARNSPLYPDSAGPPVASTSHAVGMPGQRAGRRNMRMIGQLRAVAVISTGSVHYREGTATQVPTTLRNRRGAAQEVELFDQAGGLIGMLEQSVTKTTYSLQASGHIKVVGITTGPLRGKFISPILLSFYADEQLALGIMKVLEESGLFLDQSTSETQSTIRDLGSTSNVLTQGMNYAARHPTRDADGLMTLHSNSDNALPSVFADMNFTSYGDGDGTGEMWAAAKERYRSMPLPQTMRVIGRPQQPEVDAKTRLANIKSTFVTLLDLPETEAPALITTPLRRHQKQALYFMTHRETDGVDVENAGFVDIEDEAAFPKLWTLSGERSSDPERQEYMHALVNVHCVGPPKPMLGGILADDMGLGKTLTTISLIVMMQPTRRPAQRVKFASADDSGASPSRTMASTSTRKRKQAGRGRGARRKARIARNSQPSKQRRRRAISSSSDSDSFTELPPLKRVRQSRTASRTVSSNGGSDSELTDDPLRAQSIKHKYKDEGDHSTVTADSDSSFSVKPQEPGISSSDSDSYGGEAGEEEEESGSESDDEADAGYVSDGRPVTPPPEFDNLPTRNKVGCEKTFSENYRGRYAGNTLIVCPLSTMGNWEEQVKTHVRARGLSVYPYHGNARCRNIKRLCHYDVVLTTFNVLQSEYTRETRQLLLTEEAAPAVTGQRMFDSSSEEESSTKMFQVPEDPYMSPLQAIHWHRVVLDEAHNIKERRTLSSLAAQALHADRRWCLTGTPIQNRLDDLYSLLRFLHATPLDNWRVWLTYIAGPFHASAREMARGEGGIEEGNIGANRVQRLMQSICLRRMKQQIDTKTKRTMIELPPKFETVRWLELAAGERRLYQMAEDIARNKFANMARSGTVLKNYMNILKIILRLRQLCTHPRLWSADKWSEARTLAADNSMATQVGESEPEPRARSEGGSDVKRGAKSEVNLAVKGETAAVAKPEQPAAADAKPGNLQSGSAAVGGEQSRVDEKWDAAVQAQGPLVKCEFCGGGAIPAALLQYGDAFGAADYPGPAVTRCGHLVCRQCQLVLCGAAPATAGEEAALCAEAAPMTECMLCGELLGPTDAVRLSAQRILQSLGGGAPTAAATAATAREEENPYTELDRMCSEQETSTKITTLLSDIDKIRRRKWFVDAGFGVDQQHPAVVARRAELLASPGAREKCVVFSQWTSMLDLIEPLLAEQGIRYTRLDGGMARPQRESNLRRFKRDADVEILLVSLRAGGVGLNLAHASHVFLMDAFWNPSVENQAIDRIHRLGQRNPITVTRYFVKDSIEEKIMRLQQRKAKIVDISLMDSTRRTHHAAERSGADAEDALAIATGTHSRQQRLDDLNLLLG